MKNYIGFGWGCGSFAVENAVKNLPISSERFEMLGGVPFGLTNYDTIITSLTDPYEGIRKAARILGILEARKTFLEFDEYWNSLVSDYSTDRYHIVLGPVNMRKLFYIPFSSFYSNVDHFLALDELRGDTLYVSDSDGFVQIPITKAQAVKAFNTDEIFNDGVNFCYFLLHKDIPTKCDAEMIQKARDVIRNNLIVASKKKPFLEVSKEVERILNAKEINNMIFNINSLLYRKQLQKDFVSWYHSAGFSGLEEVVPLIDRQMYLIALQKVSLSNYNPSSIRWELPQIQKLEDQIADIFINNW